MKKTLISVGLIAGVLLAGFVGHSVGQSTAPNEVEVATPRTQAAEVAPRKEVQAAGKPSQACLDALDHAEAIIAAGADGLGVAARMVQAAASFDSDTLSTGTDQLRELTGDVEDLNRLYQPNAASCRAGQ